ncbi:MAG: hypothetical protein KF703_11960 [Actinobacteria bacterium]|nr:hypothetical protein [Actinomycetota bacterium]
MIVFTTEQRDGACLVRLFGLFSADDAPSALVERLERVGRGGPLVLDLTEVTPVPGSAVTELIARLEASPRRSATVLVHADLDARRALRSLTRRLPVVPDVAQAVGGHFAAALAPRPSAAAIG